jgi:hypothetical protein
MAEDEQVAHEHGPSGDRSSGLPSSRLRPPLLADRLLEWCCPPQLLEDVQGDLQEVFLRQARREGVGLLAGRAGLRAAFLPDPKTKALPQTPFY